VFVGLFNLLPGLPLDGGQVLEALVWKITGWRTRGTMVAGWIGRVVAIGLLVWAIPIRVFLNLGVDWSNSIWMFLIASFLWSGAGQAIAGARRREALAGLQVPTMQRHAVPIPHTDTVNNARNLLAQMPDVVGVVVDDNGRPMGRINTEAAASVPPRVAETLSVESVIIPFPRGAEVPDNLSGFELLRHLDETCQGARIVPVTSNGHVSGVLDINNVATAIRSAT
jgi:hypothetical protein